jgi:hypothetical protein
VVGLGGRAEEVVGCVGCHGEDVSVRMKWMERLVMG